MHACIYTGWDGCGGFQLCFRLFLTDNCEWTTCSPVSLYTTQSAVEVDLNIWFFGYKTLNMLLHHCITKSMQESYIVTYSLSNTINCACVCARRSRNWRALHGQVPSSKTVSRHVWSPPTSSSSKTVMNFTSGSSSSLTRQWRLRLSKDPTAKRAWNSGIGWLCWLYRWLKKTRRATLVC